MIQQPPTNTTLAEARERVMRDRFNPEGAECPCCDQLAKVYSRPITSAMARWLIGLVRRWRIEDRFYATSEPWSLAINSGTGDIAKLRYWDLIYTEPLSPGETRKRCSGNWKPTKRGCEFVDDRLVISRRALIYDSELLGFDDEEVSIIGALGTDFDYRSLMDNEL